MYINKTIVFFVNELGFQTATTVLSLLGKALVCIAFAVVYVHSSELFPTEVRNVGLGTASMCARISSLAASYVGGPLVNLPVSVYLLYLLYAPSSCFRISVLGNMPQPP